MPRETDWIDTNVDFTIASGAQAFVSLITGAAPINMRGVTLTRLIISLGFTSTTVAGLWGIQQVDMGIGVTSQEAFAAGSLPDPSVPADKPQYGWVWKTSKAISQNGIGAVAVFDVMADARGQRRIQNGEVYFVADNTALLGTSFVVNCRGLIRMLTKLP